MDITNIESSSLELKSEPELENTKAAKKATHARSRRRSSRYGVIDTPCPSCTLPTKDGGT